MNDVVGLVDVNVMSTTIGVNATMLHGYEFTAGVRAFTIVSVHPNIVPRDVATDVVITTSIDLSSDEVSVKLATVDAVVIGITGRDILVKTSRLVSRLQGDVVVSTSAHGTAKLIDSFIYDDPATFSVLSVSPSYAPNNRHTTVTVELSAPVALDDIISVALAGVAATVSAVQGNYVIVVSQTITDSKEGSVVISTRSHGTSAGCHFKYDVPSGTDATDDGDGGGGGGWIYALGGIAVIGGVGAGGLLLMKKKQEKLLLGQHYENLK